MAMTLIEKLRLTGGQPAQIPFQQGQGRRPMRNVTPTQPPATTAQPASPRFGRPIPMGGPTPAGGTIPMGGPGQGALTGPVAQGPGRIQQALQGAGRSALGTVGRFLGPVAGAFGVAQSPLWEGLNEDMQRVTGDAEARRGFGGQGAAAPVDPHAQLLANVEASIPQVPDSVGQMEAFIARGREQGGYTEEDFRELENIHSEGQNFMGQISQASPEIGAAVQAQLDKPAFQGTFEGADGRFYGIRSDGSRQEISEAVMAEEEARNRIAMGREPGATGTQRRLGTEGGYADVPVFGGASSVGDTQAQMRERFGAPTVSGIQAMDAADREARTPESFRQASADRVSRMEAAEASRAAQRGVGQQGGEPTTQRDFLEAARSQGLPEPQAKLQAKLQSAQFNAEQERNEQGRVSRETNQRMAEINLERAEQSLRDSGAAAGAIRDQVALMREMRQAEGDTIDRMVKFAESLAFGEMPEATQQIISQGIADYFMNMAGSGQQQQAQQQAQEFTVGERRRQGGVVYEFDGTNWNAVG